MDWHDWNGDPATIPSGMGWVQFNWETKEQALERSSTKIEYWPWFDESGVPCVMAYAMAR